MKNTTRIGIVLGITLAFFIAEITGTVSRDYISFLWVQPQLDISVGFKTKSLALIADAFHYFNDVVAYTIAFFAAYVRRTLIFHGIIHIDTLVMIAAVAKSYKTMASPYFQTSKFTFAFHRAELVGAFFNGVFLIALALSIFLQSLERFVHIEIIEEPFLVLIIGCVGLALNSISAMVIHEHHDRDHKHGQPAHIIVSKAELGPTRDSISDAIHAKHNHTIDPPAVASYRNLGLLGVLIHILGDTINNIGVIVAAVIMWKAEPHDLKRFYVDPAASVLISLVIFAGAVPLTYKSGIIMLEGTPSNLDLVKVREDLLAFIDSVALGLKIPQVLSLHDFHVWNLSQSMILASLHVCVVPETSLVEWEQIEQTLLYCLTAYGIGHVTISPERHEAGAVSDSGRVLHIGGCKRLSFQDDFGCSAVSEMKRLEGNV
ncbi:hypothetical protein D9756_005671 [Leucocoprinus leucothites]|uniref:Uncharacterized protein n=1 Tax=Leucocoprinus leucothites TaxID=201217 RepID=A0A8H5FZ97_9AGAR|nr:hypothetical protein D9756_005671 [Leucoagaricus leucothites]